MSFNPNGSEPNKLPGLPGLPPRKPAGTTPSGASNDPTQNQPGIAGSPGFKPLPSRLGQNGNPTQPSAQPQRPVTPEPQPVVQPRFQPAQFPQQSPQPVQYQEPQQPQYTQQQVDYGQGQPNYAQQQPNYNNQGPVSFQEEEEESTSRRRGFSKKDPNKTDRSNKKDNQSKKKNFKTKKQSAYAGKRRGVIIARLAVFSIVGILAVAGISSFVPKSSGLSPSDGPLILSKVRENLNVTDFPRAKGEGVAEAFSAVYLTFTPDNREQRKLALERYVDPAILPKIEPRAATEEEIAQAKSDTALVDVGVEEGDESDEGSTDENQLDELVDPPVGSDGTSKQTVTAGPYIVGSTMFKGGTAAIFTTMTQVNGKNWLFLDIPMYYDAATDALSISGSITFSSPLETAVVPPRENSSEWASSDREIKELMAQDIGNYFKAWTASDESNIERYLAKKDGKIVATANAQEGLGGNVQLVGVTKFEVQGKNRPAEDEETAENIADFRTREADVTVTFLEPTSNIIYSQSYRLILTYVNDDWFIEDINNISALLDRDVVIKAAQEDKK